MRSRNKSCGPMRVKYNSLTIRNNIGRRKDREPAEKRPSATNCWSYRWHRECVTCNFMSFGDHFNLFIHINRLKCACIPKNTSLSQLLGRFFKCIFVFTVNMCQNWLITAMLTDYREGLNPTTPEELLLIEDRVGRHFDWDEQVRMRI